MRGVSVGPSLADIALDINQGEVVRGNKTTYSNDSSYQDIDDSKNNAKLANFMLIDEDSS